MAQFEIALGPQGDHMLNGSGGQPNFGNGSQSQFDPLSYVIPAVGGIFGQFMDYAAQQEQMAYQTEQSNTQWERYQESLALQNMYATNNMAYAHQLQEELMDKSMQMQEEYDTNKYARQMAGAYKAGINPLYGLSGASGQLVNTAPSAPSGSGYAGYQGQIPSYQRTTGANHLSGFGSYFRDQELAKLQRSQTAVNYQSVPQIQADIKRLESFARLLDNQNLTETEKQELLEMQRKLTYEQMQKVIREFNILYYELQNRQELAGLDINELKERLENERRNVQTGEKDANTRNWDTAFDVALRILEIML